MKKTVRQMLSIVLIFCMTFGVAVNAYAFDLSLNKTKATVSIGQSVQLKLYNGNKNITKNAKWSTSDKKVATVNSKGKVKTKKAGKVTIYAKYKGKKLKCTVKVRNSVSLSENEVTIPSNKDKAKVKVTFKEKGTISFKVTKGDDIVGCKWAENWKGSSIDLTINRLNNYAYGSAKIKVYSSKYKKNYQIINVSVVSKYRLVVKNELPVILYNYESPTTLNPSGISNSVQVNTVTYSVTEYGTMYIDVDFTANYSYYSGADYYYIFYKVTDENGYVVRSASIISDRLSVGDKAKETIILNNISEGKYTIEFLDHKAG